ncbi:MAG: 4Fe-4S ferredoxin, partial [Thermodesulfobacteriota bacterium]
MAKNIYERLAQYLDKLPGGFPPSPSGVELRLLKRLFAPKEAKLAVHLTLNREEAMTIAHRAKLDPGEAEQKLREMARKGLIFS